MRTSGVGRVFYARVLSIIASEHEERQRIRADKNVCPTIARSSNMMRAKRVLWCVAAVSAIAIGAMVGAQDKIAAAAKGLDQLKKGEEVTTGSGLKVTLVEESK